MFLQIDEHPGVTMSVSFSSSRHFLSTTALVTLAAAFVCGQDTPVLAQSSGETTELEQIEVKAKADDGQGPVEGYRAKVSRSATKTATPVEKIPQAISTVGAEQISDQAAQTITQATRYSPGIRSETFGADVRNDWFLMRGFRSQENSYFLDDMQLTTSAFATFKMNPYLIERIDILRGPSSALYGSSNPGGLIIMVSKRPTGNTGASVEIGVNEHGNVYSGIDVEGVANDSGSVAYRFVAHGSIGDTEVDFTKNDRLAIAPSVLIQPDEDTRLELYANYQRFKTNGQNFLPYVGTVVDAPFGRISPETFTSEPAFDGHDRKQTMLGYEFEHRFDSGVTVRQNLRYANLDVDFDTFYGVGYSGAPTATSGEINRLAFQTKPVVDLFTVDNQVEFKLSTGAVDHTILAGIDYRHYKLKDLQGFAFAAPVDVINPTYSNVYPALFYYNNNTTTQEQLGLYVQDQMDLTDRLSLVLSGRYDMVWSDVLDRTTGVSTSQDNNALSGRAGLIYNFDNGFSPYVSVSRSFLPVTGLITDSSGTQLGSYNPETGTQYEIGFKYQPAEWGDSSFGVSVFHLARQNVEATNGLARSQIGEVTSTGAEFEVVGAVTDALKVIGSYTIYDLEITEGDNKGFVPVGAPENFAALWLDYTVQSGMAEGLQLAAGARYVGSSHADTANRLKVPSAVVFDAAIRYEKNGYTIALNASNLFDKEYVSGCSDANSCFYGNGREMTLSLKKTF